MALMDEAVWRSTIYSGGGDTGDGGDTATFTDTRWVTIRGDIAPYPF